MLVLYAARSLWLPALASCLDVGQPPSQADYVLVLPGGEETRPFVAAALVKRGYGHTVLAPQTAASPEMQDGLIPPTFEIIRRVLERRGLKESQLQALDSASSSTWEDAEALAGFLKSQPKARVLAVTHHYHTRRSRWVFRQVLGREAARLTFVSAPTDDFDATNWWRTKVGLRAIVSEYFKFAYYLLRYGDWRAWSVLIAAAALALFRAACRSQRSQASGERRPPDESAAGANSRNHQGAYVPRSPAYAPRSPMFREARDHRRSSAAYHTISTPAVGPWK